MKASYKTICQFVDLSSFTVEEVAKRLTFAGIEVESIQYLAKGNNLVIGEIIECEPHQDSDHLHVLKVNLGSKHGIKQIVCGAPNARKGLKVIVALEGAKLPLGEIKPSVIRGVNSNGMCCSLLELGVDKKYLNEEQTKGIEELPLTAPIGEEDVLGYLGLDDCVLEINVLANRPDLLGVYNIAREIAGLLSLPMKKLPKNEYNEVESSFSASSLTNLCTQFSIKEIYGIKNKATPMWMKSALMAMGVRSINQIVDIGNYAMLITGQPLNIYDLDKLKTNSLKVNTGIEGDYKAMDDKVYHLNTDDIVIIADEEPVCIAGVMTLDIAKVDENTTSILVESASFDSTAIRHTSSRLGLISESSSRFVKGTNHHQAEEVLNYVSYLFSTLAGVSSIHKSFHYSNEKQSEKRIIYSIDYINNLLATDFSKQEIDFALTNLGFKIIENEVIVPSFRLDVFGPADLAEEVIRFYGLDRVKVSLPTYDILLGGLSDEKEKERKLTSLLLHLGLDQCLTYTLVNEKLASSFKYLSSDEVIKVMHPLTVDHEILRPNLLPSLIDTSLYNVSRKQTSLGLFETSEVYTKNNVSTRLAIVLTGETKIQGRLHTIKNDFYVIKGYLENILSSFGIEPNRYRIEPLISSKNEFHPFRSAVLKFGKEVVGVFGELHPEAKAALGFNNLMVSALELNLSSLFALKTSKIKFNPISKFPFIERDLAFVVSKSIPLADLVKEIRKVGGSFVTKAEIFDVFSGKGIAEGCVSVAVSIRYESSEKTLLDKEVCEIEAKIRNELEKKYKATLRG